MREGKVGEDVKEKGEGESEETVGWTNE